VIRGSGENDDLFGDEGDDELFGGEGDDDLDGGIGTDTCAQEGGFGTILGCETVLP
jgi:Ca2+-binding RTX toxin-like protein